MAAVLILVCAAPVFSALDTPAGFRVYAAENADIAMGDHIYMGRSDVPGYSGLPLWRVIDRDDDGYLLLMSEYLWLGDGSDPDTMIQFNPQAFHYEWAESNARTWCGNFEAAVLGNVYGLTIMPTVKSDTMYNSPDFENVVYQERENILNGDKVFFLSAEEVAHYMPAVPDRVAYLHDGTYTGESESWWLRSPRWLSELNSVTCAGRVFSEGRIGKNEVYQYSAMRPAMWVRLSEDAVIEECVHGDMSTWIVDSHENQQSFTRPRYRWSADNSSCTAETTCKRCGTVLSERVDATSAVTKAATVSETGVMTYTAEFANPVFVTQTKKLLIPKKDAPPAVKPAAKVKVDLPAVTIVKPKAGKKKLTVKWKKISKKNLKKIKGIEINCVGPGINKTFTAGSTKTSKAIKGLKSKKTYKVKVRAYTKKNGVKHVSKWSKVKKIKVK